MSLVSEDILVRALSKQLNIPAVNLDAVQSLPAHVRAKIPSQTARDFAVLPLQLRDDGKTLVVAVADPLNVRHLDELRAITKCRIVPNVAGRTSIARAYSRLYDGAAELAEADTNFKVLDAQGRTVVKEVRSNGAAPQGTPRPAPPAAPARPSSGAIPSVRPAAGNPSELLKTVEEVQRKEVAALKAMVELLIEKGVFTREEYLAKVKR
jgi:hypothetical protein